MAASEKLTLENFRDLSLEDLEKVAYSLQIEYDPPLTEEQRPKVLDYIEYIIRNHDEYNKEAVIRRRKRDILRKKRSCNDEKTAIMQKDVGLMSDAQLVFLPQIEIKYFCLDRLVDLPYAIENKINPINKAPLTNDQLQFLIEQKDNIPFSNIRAGEFFEEIEQRIGGYASFPTVQPIISSRNLNKSELSQQFRIGSLYNNPQYQEWIVRNLKQLLDIINKGKLEIHKPDVKICNMDTNCLELLNPIGRGGGSYIIETRYKTENVSAANNLFPVSPKYRFAMKLCDIGLLYTAGCRE